MSVVNWKVSVILYMHGTTKRHDERATTVILNNPHSKPFGGLSHKYLITVEI